MAETILKCGNCQKIVTDEFFKFVYETYSGMPDALKFYCPYCKAILEIYLEWKEPIIRSAKVVFTRAPKEGIPF